MSSHSLMTVLYISFDISKNSALYAMGQDVFNEKFREKRKKGFLTRLSKRSRSSVVERSPCNLKVFGSNPTRGDAGDLVFDLTLI